MEKAYTSNETKTLDEFMVAREQLEAIIVQLQMSDTVQWRHEQTEQYIHKQGQELCRLLLQGALDCRSRNECFPESIARSTFDGILRQRGKPHIEQQNLIYKA